MDILWRQVFHILTEPVPFSFVCDGIMNRGPFHIGRYTDIFFTVYGEVTLTTGWCMNVSVSLRAQPVSCLSVWLIAAVNLH